MSKRMYIDASHPEETRVVVLDGNKVEEFDFEAASRRPLKGNIYLAKVTRVEPSLQAAFVEYGGNRQGFLAFSEIHPDYYQIPVADRLALIAAQSARRMDDDDVDSFDSIPSAAPGEEGAEMDKEDREEEDQEESEGGITREEVEADGDEARAHDSEDAHDDRDDVAVHDSNAAHASDEHDHDHDDHDHDDHGHDDHHHDDHEDDGEDNDIAERHEADALTDLEAGAVVHDDGGLSESNDSRVEVLTEATGAPIPAQRADHRQDRPRAPRRRPYKIQEVIKRRQIMLVQVVKEERGNKGAALTTFMSLAGRYCVLMPNTPRGGGISRKITNATDRRRLKSAAQSLELPEGMGLIIRTAGANRTKVEIKRDYEYLLRLWDSVRELTLKSNAPALVYEEGNLIKRVIRDLYNKDISEIIVDGEEGYREAKEFMRMLMPSHAKNVKPYKEPLPLFQSNHIDAQLDAMFSPTVTLKSGGYIVINQTEALVAIDVNSGKATREHNIEDTATKTNLEAADEVGRQLRLRDLAGLIVIDFIDMEDGKNDRLVEKRLRDALRGDRARVQVGKISQFGLLEMSRQRLRSGVIAGSTVTCPHCGGQGIIRSTESAALRLLRALDEEGAQKQSVDLLVKAPSDVTIYTLNQKRREIARIEEAYDLVIAFDPQVSMVGGTFEIERTRVRVPTARPKPAVSPEDGLKAKIPEAEDVTLVEAPEDDMIAEEIDEEFSETGEETSEARHDDTPRGENRPASTQGHGEVGSDGQRKRRRRRRGGRGRNGRPHEGGEANGHAANGNAPMPIASGDAIETTGIAETDDSEPQQHGQQLNGPQQQGGEDGGRRRRRRRRGRHRRREGGDWQEGQPGAQPHIADAPENGHSENGHADSYAPPAAPVESPADNFVVAPNMPSQPQWSLTGEQPQAAWPEPKEAKPAAAEPMVPAEPQAVREERKGWWQRRFKIGE